jgi:hypothetical protein
MFVHQLIFNGILTNEKWNWFQNRQAKWKHEKKQEAYEVGQAKDALGGYPLTEAQHRRTAPFHSDMSHPMQRFLGELEDDPSDATEHPPENERSIQSQASVRGSVNIRTRQRYSTAACLEGIQYQLLGSTQLRRLNRTHPSPLNNSIPLWTPRYYAAARTLGVFNPIIEDLATAAIAAHALRLAQADTTSPYQSKARLKRDGIRRFLDSAEDYSRRWSVKDPDRGTCHNILGNHWTWKTMDINVEFCLGLAHFATHEILAKHFLRRQLARGIHRRTFGRPFAARCPRNLGTFSQTQDGLRMISGSRDTHYLLSDHDGVDSSCVIK